jgi:acyl-coenzyme A thioesterase PaaI-like protein
MAVTINLNINFLRKPKPDADLLARAEMLKVGKRLGVGEVYIRSAGDDAPVAHATITYSIPEGA